MRIRGSSAIRNWYRDEEIVRTYVDRRFREPLGALLHARQVRWLKHLVRLHRPRRVLEIAPGPARLTVEVAPILESSGTLIDTSAEMLALARRRLAGVARAPWRFVQGDVFHLPFRSDFDLVYVFRLIRHFEAPERARIYAEIVRALRPGGRLVFDAVNESVSMSLRTQAPAGEYTHYDALFRPETLRAELGAADLEVVSLAGVQRRYGALARLQVVVAPRCRPLARLTMEAVDRVAGGDPLEWIVTCRRA